MRRLLMLLLVLSVLALGVLIGVLLGGDDEPGSATNASAAAATATDSGSLELTVDQAAVDAKPGVAAVLDQVDLESAVAELDDLLRLPRDVTLAVRDDPDEAYYDPDSHMIVLSPSLVAQTAKTMDDIYDDAQDALVAAASSVRFTVLHELGHALVDVLELPTTGLEETAVDEFAVVALIDYLDDPIAVLEASDEFDAIAAVPEEADYYDEHALDQQRFFHMRCLVYGTDPEKYADEIDGLDLDAGRADLCVDESKHTRRAWKSLLAPYLDA